MVNDYFCYLIDTFFPPLLLINMPLSWVAFRHCAKWRILSEKVFGHFFGIIICRIMLFFLAGNIAQTLVSKWTPSVQDEHNTWYKIIDRKYIDLWFEFIDFWICFGYWISRLNVATSTTTQNADCEVILKQEILLTKMNQRISFILIQK